MPDTPFKAAVHKRNDVPVIALEGDINGLAEADLNAAFSQALHGGATTILLNFERVSYINSTGIALVVGLLAEARKLRAQILVCGLTDHYRHIFNITRLADFMSIHDDEAAALREAAPSQT